MLDYSFHELTFYDFDVLLRGGAGDLLDAERFCELLKRPLLVARATFLIADFPDGKPSLAEFLASIRAEDIPVLRTRLLEAYKAFFQAPGETVAGGETTAREWNGTAAPCAI